MLVCWYADMLVCLHVGMLIYHHAFQRLLGLPSETTDTNTVVFSFRPCIILSNNALRTFAAPNDSIRKARATIVSEVVNLRAVSVRYADNALYIIYIQNFAFAECLYPCPNRRGDNPEQFADFSLGHGGCAYIARQGDIALPVHRDNVPFFFHRYSVLN